MSDIPTENVLDLRTHITQAPERAWRSMLLGHWWKALLLVNIFVLAFLFFGIISAILWSVFFAFVFYRWDTRIIGSFAILALTACPILLALEEKAFAEQMAVYAYYFLVMTVLLQIIEFKFRPEGIEKPKLLSQGKVLDLRTPKRGNS
ncbi:hypothetical protein A2704_03440 [Candidatus Kaiserbacteria bacterium RIFCSPHIGHO2_01_FULL_54_36b]|uniref:Uncharacterized protein n=1 Tax=Candidatus Kaiserbacteria bacterium RIFCSPHIGHO2_01_FULL_54_36b TaxID=1798483 RepID=A0A1F6CQI7_9BACT|nr:MAG: hypothetical protein A2704_03440 [Candidatus Kaiserbacteria bacterium RIFCSPHIGHO2_01_FULL_54_36b]